MLICSYLHIPNQECKKNESQDGKCNAEYRLSRVSAGL